MSRGRLVGLLLAVASAGAVLSSDAAAATSDWQSLAGGGGSGRPLVAAASNGKLYALYIGTGIFKSFDPVANTWASQASHAGSGAAIAGGDHVYLFGGRSSSTPALGSVAEYDPAANAWSARASMPVAVASGAATIGPDGRYYLVGGMDNETGPTCDRNGGCFYGGVQIYDPATNSWSLGSAGPSSTSVYEMDAVSPGDGWIYVPSAGEAYSPATDTWKLTSLPPHPDFTFTATGGGQVAGFWSTVVGTARDDVVNVYTPTTDTWSDGTPRAEGITTASAALTADGRDVLIGEGFTMPAATRAFLDVTAPSGSFTINAGATSTSSSAVSIDSTPNDTSGIATIRVANSGSTSGGLLTTGQNLPYGPHVSWQLAGSPGNKTVWVQWLDPFGHWSSPVSHSITLTTSFTFTKPPAPTLPATGPITDTATPIKISWKATDPVAIVGYQLTQSTDGGAFIGIFNGNATSTKPKLAYGHTYVEHATATDLNSATVTSTGPSFDPTLIQQIAATTSGPWQAQSGSAFSGGDDLTCTVVTCSASYSFTGRAIGWVSTIGPNNGAALVSVDGEPAVKVDTVAATAATRRLVYSHNWTSSAAHTITITCSATAGRPRIDLDAFIVVA
jgi:Kelch motif